MIRLSCLTLFIGLIVASLISNTSSNVAGKMLAADKYKVIKVDGKIILEKTKEDLKKGDVFLAGMALNFKTPQSRAAVISSLKGRFILSASEKGQAKILPAANNLSSRAGALINMIDLQNHFSGRYLVIGEMKLAIGKEAFPLDNEHFFYLSFDHQGETIRKKLNAEDNHLVLNKEDIFKVDGESITYSEKEMILYYRSEGESRKINNFTPVFPSLVDLKDEVRIILDEYSDKDNEKKIKEVTSYLNEFYGRPQKDNLGAWLEAEFQLK